MIPNRRGFDGIGIRHRETRVRVIRAVVKTVNTQRTWILAGGQTHPCGYSDGRNNAFQAPPYTSRHESPNVGQTLVAEQNLRCGTIEPKNTYLHRIRNTFFASSHGIIRHSPLLARLQCHVILTAGFIICRSKHWQHHFFAPGVSAPWRILVDRDPSIRFSRERLLCSCCVYQACAASRARKTKPSNCWSCCPMLPARPASKSRCARLWLIA